VLISADILFVTVAKATNARSASRVVGGYGYRIALVRSQLIRKLTLRHTHMLS